jgi:hypothetical protein
MFCSQLATSDPCVKKKQNGMKEEKGRRSRSE